MSQDEEEPGTALAIVKDKWNELGPLKLEEIASWLKSTIDSDDLLSYEVEYYDFLINFYHYGNFNIL
jgi:hypothetical protein